MVIGVDAGALGVSNNNLKAGVYYVSYYLLKELSRLDKKNTYLLYSFLPLSKSFLSELPANFKNIVIPSKGWLYLSLPIQFFVKKPDVFLALSQAMPWFHPFKTIGFVHGMDFSKKFHVYGNNLEKLELQTEYVCTHADSLITTSAFLKASIQKNYPQAKISIVPLGVDKIFRENTKKYTLDHPYFLFVGSIKPSKNIPLLLHGFKGFLRKIKKPYYLLCIGSTQWVDTEVMKLIHDLHLENQVVLEEAIVQENLPDYYKGAVAFVSPSLYEGFGLPFLEAMASGCPVIGSKVGGIPEIVGESGILIDPKNVAALSEAFCTMVSDTRKRNVLKVMGEKQSEKFTWEKFGHKVFDEIKIYEKETNA